MQHDLQLTSTDKATFAFRIAVVAFVCLTAIGSPETAAAQPQVGSVAQPISGTVDFEGCDAAARNNINDALALILDRLEDAMYLACLKDAVLTETFGATPEAVLLRLRDDVPTRVICQDVVCGGPGFLGCAGVADGEEVFTIQNDHVRNGAPVDVAATIVHEVAHRKGFGHPGSTGALDYAFTIPVQAATCIRNLVADGLDRSDAPGDTELPPLGGIGGESFQRRCGQGRVVTGMEVVSSDLVNGITLHCEGGDLPRVGSNSDSTRAVDRRCAPDRRVVALRAQFGDRPGSPPTDVVSYLAMACARLSDLSADVQDPAVDWRYLGGGGGDPGGLRECPTGMAVKGLVGHAGARIDEIRVLCEDVDGISLSNPHALALAGSRTGRGKIGFCLGRGAMTALYGHSGGSIDRLGGSCHPTRSGSIFGTPEVVGGNATRHVFDWNGGNGGQRFTLACRDGDALVGIATRGGATRVDAIRGTCVDPAEWSSSNATVTRRNTSFRGDSTGAIASRTCPRGEYLVGLETWAAQTVHAEPTVQGVVPYCRRLDDRPVAPPTGPLEG